MEENNLTLNGNLTETALSVLSDMRKKVTHPAPCACTPCLYYEYQKGPKGSGRPVRGLMFFLAWLVHSVKLEYLKKALLKKGKSLELPLPMYLQHYKKAPYLKRTMEILDSLDDYIFDYSLIVTYKSRIEKFNFLKLEDKLIKRRGLKWLKSHPKEEKDWTRNWADLRLAQRIADYIHSNPGKRITQRYLHRKFDSRKSPISSEDFERIKSMLRGNYKIEIKQEKKSIVYRKMKG